MPRSKTGNKRSKVSEDSLSQAIKAVKEDGLSVRMASKQFSVSRTTLQRHLQDYERSGDNVFRLGNKNAVWKVFTDEEEKCLVTYLTKACHMHYGLTRGEVMILAYQFAKSISKKYPITWDANGKAGLQWLTDFLKKHPLSLRMPRATSIARATGFNKPIVEKFFDKYKEVLNKHKFTPDRIYNMDESGLSTVHNPPKVVAPTGVKQVGGITSSERGVNVTIISCINAIGNSVPPVLVFPRVNFKTHMMHGAPPGSIGTCNPSGWSSSEIFVNFLDHFITHVHPTKENKALILLDNHETHITIEAINKARENGIVMFTIPPHTSHKLQPLDRGVFGPFKQYYNKACQHWIISNPGKPITIYDIGKLVGDAYPLAFTPKNIQSGFSVSGIWPVNTDVFGDNEYAPSQVTDRPHIVEHSYAAQPIKEGEQNNLNQDCSKPSTSSVVFNSETPSPKLQHNERSAELLESLEKIKPFPKADLKPRKKGGRKCGRSRVITETPEKLAIEQDVQNRKQGKKRLMEKSKCTNKTTKKTMKKTCKQLFMEKKKNTTKSQQAEDMSSDEMSSIAMSDSESDTSLTELARRHDFELDGEKEYDVLFQDQNIDKLIKESNWVLVSFPTKKTIKHFVGHVISVNTGILTVKFLRRVKQTSFFVWPQQEDISEVDKEDVVVILPNPSTQKRGGLCFPVSFDGFNVY